MRSFPLWACASVALALGLPAVGRAADWPQWLGPDRNSVWNEDGIVDTLPAGGLPTRWRQAIGGGFAGPAVADGRVFVMDYLTEKPPIPAASRREDLTGTERVLCFAAADGKLLWKHEYDRPYHISYATGPRATPAVDGDRVYTLGAEGDLKCLRVSDGKVVWSRNLPHDYHFETPSWGCASHPLVDGQKLICLVGGEGSIVGAFDKLTGQELWHSLSAKETGYSAPVIIQAGGVRQLVVWDADALHGLDPESGKVYWSQPLQPDWGMSIATPRSDGNYLFAGGIVLKSALFQLSADRPAADVVWLGEKGVGIAPTTNTPFLENGYLYGVDREGELRCVELATGKQVWTTYAATTSGQRSDNASAFLVKHGDRFFIFNEKGELILARLTPGGYQELSRAKILEPTTSSYGRLVVWSHPAFAERSIFARNDREIVCVSLAQ
jgi:outer membrane protein assembly factor BamB